MKQIPRNMGKLSGDHATVIEPAEAPIKAAIRREEVTKVSVGQFKQGRTKSPHLKFEEEPVGWKVTVLGPTYKQFFFIHTSDRAATRAAMEAAFEHGK